MTSGSVAPATAGAEPLSVPERRRSSVIAVERQSRPDPSSAAGLRSVLTERREGDTGAIARMLFEERTEEPARHQTWMSVGVDDNNTQVIAPDRRAECHWDALTTLTKDSRTLLPPHTSHPKVNQCYIVQSMGCVKSKRSDSAGQNANSIEKAECLSRGTRGEKAYLVHSEMGSAVETPPQVNPVLLEYAQRLSEEIVARAVQQWVEVDRRYSDIPYIECDVP
ncbi:hypothetical protein INR49_026798 [Caranx melampygus]|nr:hypothetical protein INR49_026798 [Caranx melampygus]